jgi:hypothetical protein
MLCTESNITFTSYNMHSCNAHFQDLCPYLPPPYFNSPPSIQDMSIHPQHTPIRQESAMTRWTTTCTPKKKTLAPLALKPQWAWIGTNSTCVPRTAKEFTFPQNTALPLGLDSLNPLAAPNAHCRFVYTTCTLSLLYHTPPIWRLAFYLRCHAVRCYV